MLFGIDDVNDKVTVKTPEHVEGGEYVFSRVIRVSEAELFRDFKKRKFIKNSMDELETARFNDTAHSIRFAEIGSNVNDTMFPYSGSYIIPKMFGYFPFLDCDSINTYEDAKFHLTLDEIPYVTFKSSNLKDRYWIFCDRQLPINDAIDFIEGYPCDHRYAWVARHKQELCVRALPKNAIIPVFDENYKSNDFSDDFAYWILSFTKYWTEGLIPKYINNILTLNNI